jgi:hypothetical protein
MATVTRRDVDRELRRTLWPDLRTRGFTRQNGRTAWQDRNAQVNVVEVSFFNPYDAGVLGVSSFSFRVLLGVFPRCRTTGDTPREEGRLAPPEYHCEFRRSLRSRVQLTGSHDATVWSVATDGSNIAPAVEDAHQVLMSEGLSWFESLDGLEKMLWTTENVENGNTDQTWGMGRLGSPDRISLLADLRKAAFESNTELRDSRF